MGQSAARVLARGERGRCDPRVSRRL